MVYNADVFIPEIIFYHMRLPAEIFDGIAQESDDFGYKRKDNVFYCHFQVF